MPRIKRWFNVSHEINSDPEVWELTDTFGDWLLRVWLQMLSIGDRNEFRIKGERRWIESRMATLWRSNSRRYGTEWRRNRVSMALDWMVNKGWIRFESDGIFICNQAKYNIARGTKEIPVGKPIASPPSSPSLPSDPSLPSEPTKIRKKTLAHLAVSENGFSAFWQAYPRKKSKGQARKAWAKLHPDEQLQDRLLQALERAKTSAEWIKDGGEFIPYPASWLNAEGWEDQPTEGASRRVTARQLWEETKK